MYTERWPVYSRSRLSTGVKFSFCLLYWASILYCSSKWLQMPLAIPLAAGRNRIRNRPPKCVYLIWFMSHENKLLKKPLLRRAVFHVQEYFRLGTSSVPLPDDDFLHVPPGLGEEAALEVATEPPLVVLLAKLRLSLRLTHAWDHLYGFGYASRVRNGTPGGRQKQRIWGLETLSRMAVRER